MMEIVENARINPGPVMNRHGDGLRKRSRLGNCTPFYRRV
jgi:hypothetical protein